MKFPASPKVITIRRRKNAPEKRIIKENDLKEHQDRNEGRTSSETSHSDSLLGSQESKEKECLISALAWDLKDMGKRLHYVL